MITAPDNAARRPKHWYMVTMTLTSTSGTETVLGMLHLPDVRDPESCILESIVEFEHALAADGEVGRVTAITGPYFTDEEDDEHSPN